jgi:hypothetical protein
MYALLGNTRSQVCVKRYEKSKQIAWNRKYATLTSPHFQAEWIKG